MGVAQRYVELRTGTLGRQEGSVSVTQIIEAGCSGLQLALA
jgi:hypothetical protein